MKRNILATAALIVTASIPAVAGAQDTFQQRQAADRSAAGKHHADEKQDYLKRQADHRSATQHAFDARQQENRNAAARRHENDKQAYAKRQADHRTATKATFEAKQQEDRVAAQRRHQTGAKS